MSPEDAAIAGYIKVIISKSSGEEERRGARQALGQYGQRAVLAVSAAMSALNKDGEDYRRLNATLKIIRARLSRTSASGADVKTLSPDEGVVMEVIARVKDLQTARFTASDFLEACKDDDVADLASRFSLSRDQATGILHSLAEKGVLDIIDLPNRSRQFKLTEDARIGIMARSANEVGLQIPTHSDERYTLIVNNDLYKNRELEADVKGYQLYGRHVGAGDRFGLMACDTSKVNNILSKVSDAARTVVQVAEGFSEADAAELMRRAPGIRIMRIDTAGFKYDQALDNESRRNCRFNLYAMMLAARKITKEDVLQNSAAYRLLSFFVNTHFKDGAEDIAESYIDALINSDKIAFIINHNLSYKPAKRWRRPTYSTVAAALISA
jgi:hypothetical protein